MKQDLQPMAMISSPLLEGSLNAVAFKGFLGPNDSSEPGKGLWWGKSLAGRSGLQLMLTFLLN